MGKPLIFVLLLVVLAAAAYFLPIASWLSVALAWVEANPGISWLAFILAYIAACVLLFAG